MHAKKLNKLKRIVDIIMIILFLLLMSYQYTGQKTHEYIGVGLFFFILFHMIINITWYHSLGRGKYSFRRFIQTTINMLLLLDVIAMFTSGIIMSGYVFVRLPVQGFTYEARLIHLFGAYWGLLLISIHIGLHWNMVTMHMRKLLISEFGKSLLVFLRFFGVVLSLFGIYSFHTMEIDKYLFLKSEFYIWDEENFAMLMFKYISIMSLCIMITHFGIKKTANIIMKLRKRNAKRGESL